jgi:hypothetical protein
MKLKSLTIRSGLGLLVLLFGGQAQAYICTGGGSPGYSDNLVTFPDSTCGQDQLVGILTDNLLLSKYEVDDGATEGVWPDALEVTQVAEEGMLGKVIFTWAGVNFFPQIMIEKHSDLYSIYDWATQVVSEGGNSYSFTRPPQLTGAGGTSHVSAVGPVPIPAAAWLFGSALLGMLGIGYHRRRKA